MKRINLQLMLLFLVTALAMSACGSLPFEEVTPTADVNAVMTAAAATAFVQLTEMANAQATTDAQPTATLQPTQTEAPTQTSSPLEQITATPGAGAAALSSPTPGLALATATSAVPGALPTATPIGGAITIPSNATAVTPCLASQYIADVTIQDKEEVKALAHFTKIWRIKNIGTCDWKKGFGLVYFNGEKMSGQPAYFSINDPVIKPGMQVDIPISMIAPEKKGEFYGEWIMVDDKGQSFGYPFYIIITVVK